MASQIPPLLEPYLSLPADASQILLTGVLGATTNWLVLRYLYSLLLLTGPATGAPQAGPVAVLLVSFMRDYAFWRDGAGRLGLDLDSLAADGRFLFVDGLSRLFLGGGGGAGRLGPGCVAHVETARVADVARLLHAAVESMLGAARPGLRLVLVLDQPDLLLAAAGPGHGVSASAWRDVLLDLREKVYATVLTLSADEPLISAQTTTLEKQHAAFVLDLAHAAQVVMSARLLDTGTAKDVSGVLRITRGGAALHRAVEDHEFLYHVGGDGRVKLFERGQQ